MLLTYRLATSMIDLKGEFIPHALENMSSDRVQAAMQRIRSIVENSGLDEDELPDLQFLIEDFAKDLENLIPED